MRLFASGDYRINKNRRNRIENREQKSLQRGREGGAGLGLLFVAYFSGILALKSRRCVSRPTRMRFRCISAWWSRNPRSKLRWTSTNSSKTYCRRTSQTRWWSCSSALFCSSASAHRASCGVYRSVEEILPHVDVNLFFVRY